jgi:hypothetical protein
VCRGRSGCVEWQKRLTFTCEVEECKPLPSMPPLRRVHTAAAEAEAALKEVMGFWRRRLAPSDRQGPRALELSMSDEEPGGLAVDDVACLPDR